MNKTISDLISEQKSERFAVDAGSAAHAKMQFIHPGSELMSRVKSVRGLSDFFGDNSRAEVPVAAILHGHFVSRRIDRLVIDDANKTIKILDYKTDINKSEFYNKYKLQLGEYREILSQIYPKYTIETYILWLHDWCLEQI